MTRINRTIATLTLLAVLMPDLGETARSQDVARKTLTISGRAGLHGVTMQGLPDNPVSDENGVYSAKVPYGWSGVAVPMKLGYQFNPPRREYTSLTADLTSEDYRASRLTFIISGNVGLPGVVMKGLPGEFISDENGAYSATVEYGWSGTVKPEKRGFVFSPVSKSYTRVTQDHKSEDYNPSVITFTISGETGVAGVRMRGLPGDPVTDRQGSYKVTVEYGWSGRVTPAREGYEFEPARRAYPSVMEALTHEDYIARAFTYRISGNVGLPGVVLKGLPDDPISDTNGNYSVRIPYGWTGKVTPEREGVRFEPAARVYTRVMADLSGGDYIPSIRNLPPFGAGTSEALVIPTGEVDLKGLAEIREDMRVMLQILREKLSEPRMILGTLYDYGDFFGRDGRGVEAVYLQGYGALFMVEVEFPMSFPSEPRAEDERDREQVVDPVWQRARERLYVPPAPLRYGSSGRPNEASEMSFEQFREELLKTLRHAANLRHIEPNEVVILTVIGQGGQGSPSAPYGGGMMGGYGTGMMGGMGGYGVAGGYSSSGGSFSGGTGGYGGGGGFYVGSSGHSSASGGASTSGVPRVTVVPASATVLTLQAKKADIDAFAKGEIDLEQFRQKVKTFTY